MSASFEINVRKGELALTKQVQLSEILKEKKCPHLANVIIFLYFKISPFCRHVRNHVGYVFYAAFNSYSYITVDRKDDIDPMPYIHIKIKHIRYEINTNPPARAQQLH